MNFDLRPLIGLEVALVLAVFALIAWRKAVSRGEDDSLHVLQAETISQQSAVAHKLEVIDKWGKSMTAVAVVFGLLWMQGTQVPAGF